MALLVVWIIGAIVAGVVANNKKRSVGGWVVGSLLVSPLIIIILLVLPPLEGGAVHETGNGMPDSRKCPFCAETIKAEAIVCKHCGKDLPQGEKYKTYEFK